MTVDKKLIAVGVPVAIHEKLQKLSERLYDNELQRTFTLRRTLCAAVNELERAVDSGKYRPGVTVSTIGEPLLAPPSGGPESGIPSNSVCDDVPVS